MASPLPDHQLAAFTAKAKMGKAGLIVALLCAALASLGFLDATASLAIKLGLAIPFGIIAALAAYLGLRPAKKHPFIVALRNRHAEIVWIYAAQQLVNNRHANTYVTIGLRDGKTVALAIGKDPPDGYLDQLRAIAPAASVGYTEQLRAQFKQAPQSLAG